MLTLDILKDFGANVDEGLARCMNNTDFYLRLVNMALDDGGFQKLSDAAGAGDIDTLFDAAHALKGVLGNLSLTPLFDKASALTELARARAEADYPALAAELTADRDRLKALGA